MSVTTISGSAIWWTLTSGNRHGVLCRWSMPERLRGFTYRRYINTRYLYLYPFSVDHLSHWHQNRFIFSKISYCKFVDRRTNGLADKWTNILPSGMSKIKRCRLAGAGGTCSQPIPSLVRPFVHASARSSRSSTLFVTIRRFYNSLK